MRINFNRWALPNRIGVSTRQLKLPLCQSQHDASLGFAGIMKNVFRGKNDIGEVYSDRVGTPNLLGIYTHTSRLLLILQLLACVFLHLSPFTFIKGKLWSN